MADLYRETDVVTPGTISVAAALGDILTWSQHLPEWQREALRRICTKGILDETDLDELTSLCKDRGTGGDAFNASHVPDPDAASETLNVRAIQGVKNVNALKPGERLSFNNAGLTVVYGDNGSGKSGYARVLKKVCRARSSAKESSILPNIYTTDHCPPQAIIDYCVNGQHRSMNWIDDQEVDPALSMINVFDRYTADVHVADANSIAYTPFPMHMLEQLAIFCRQVKQRIVAEINQLELQTPETIKRPRCHAHTAVGKFVAGIGENSKERDVRALATLSHQEKARLESLKADIGTEPVKKVRQIEALENRLDVFNTKFEALQNTIGDGQIARLTALFSNHRVAQKAAEAAAGSIFSEEPLTDVGSEVWRSLWEAARLYSEEQAYPDKQFPFTGDEARCVLCQQELNSEASNRLIRFERFVKDEAKRKEEQAAEAYRTAHDETFCVDVSISEIRDAIALIRDELNDDELAETARRAAMTLKWGMRAIRRHHTLGDQVTFPTAEYWPADAVVAHCTALSERIRALQAEDKSEERKQMRDEYEELKDREWLSVILEDVIVEISRRKKRSVLNAALKDTKTNRITNKSGEIAERLVTNALFERFANEIDRLGLGALRIELRRGQSNYGVPHYRVGLSRKPDATVAEILSEGEHRCVALAAFLAELATTESRSAIVFDDPVSSLDHNYREDVARRLAEEGNSRQVIVFTHDIAFLFLLDQTCREKHVQIAFRSVSRNDDYAGFVQQVPPMRAQPVKEVIEGLKRQLDNKKRFYENGEHDKWEKTVDVLLKRLRETWERAVEEALSPVFKRLSHKVKTRGLGKVTALTMEDCIKMRNAYGLCSIPLHSTSEALNPAMPKPFEIQSKITELRTWVEDIKERQSRIDELQ